MVVIILGILIIGAIIWFSRDKVAEVLETTIPVEEALPFYVPDYEILKDGKPMWEAFLIFLYFFMHKRKIGERGKGKKTLEKEERRRVFDKIISDKWECTIDKLKPEYIADQFMGKSPDELKIGVLKIEVAKEIADKNAITQSPKPDSKWFTPIPGA